MQKVPALLMNGDDYVASFEALMCNGLIEREAICTPDMNTLFADMSFTKDKEIRVLSIGSGKGGNDVPIIDALIRNHSPKLYYEVIEPFVSHVDQFKSLVQRKGDSWHNVKFTYNVQTIQEYMKTTKTKENCVYDVIHALHCMYHFPRDTDIFRHLYDMLSSPGIMLLRHGGFAPGNGWRKMMTHFYEFYSNETEPYYNFDLIVDSVREQLQGIDTEIIHRDTGSINITECFNEHSQEGNKMLNYLFQCVDFRKYLPGERVEYFLSYLKDKCCVVQGDKIYLPAHEADIVIKK